MYRNHAQICNYSTFCSRVYAMYRARIPDHDIARLETRPFYLKRFSFGVYIDELPHLAFAARNQLRMKDMRAHGKFGRITVR